MPGWNSESQTLYDTFKVTGNLDTGKELLELFDKNRKETWERKMESMNFAKSSRKAWSLIGRLSGKAKKKAKVCPITLDQIALKLVENSKGVIEAQQKKKINKNYLRNFRQSQPNSTLSAPVSLNEVNGCLDQIESGKAPGTDSVCIQVF